MGFADRLEQARAAQEKQTGPITAAEGNKMILSALTHAVETNHLQKIYAPAKIASQARALSQMLDFDPFCEKYGIAPLIAADLLQVSCVLNICQSFIFLIRVFPVPTQLALYDVVLFIDDSGSMLEGSKWRDLQAISQQIVEMTTKFDTDGIQASNCILPRKNPKNCSHGQFLPLFSRFSAHIVSISLTPAAAGRVHEQRCARR